jgi:cytochrome oxidase assembly protein ShyY1
MPHPIDPAAQRTRRRFRPAVVPTLAMLAAVAVFVAAGRWQQARMHEKEALRAQLDAAQRLAPAAIAGLPGAADWAALRFRPVVAVGAYRAAAQILIDNRVHEGRAGYDVVAPLELPDGRAVLVDRGWVAQGATRAELPHVPPPGGTVTVEGRLALPAARYLELQPASRSRALRRDDRHSRAAGGDRADRRAGTRRRPRARLAGAGFRQRTASDLHGPVVCVRRARGDAVGDSQPASIDTAA